MKPFNKIWDKVVYGLNKISLKTRICFYVSLNKRIHKFDNKIIELKDRYEIRYTIHSRQKLAERMAMDISSVYGEMTGVRASEFAGVGSVYAPLYISNISSNIADQNFAVGIALGGVNRGEVLSSRGEALYSMANGSPFYEFFSYDTASLESYNNIVQEENALNNYLASQNNIKEENRLKEKRSNVKNSIEQLEIGD